MTRLRHGTRLLSLLSALIAGVALPGAALAQQQTAWPLASWHTLPALVASLHPGTAGQPRIRTRIDSQALQIPWSSWPSQASNEKGTQVSASLADNPDKNFFADNTFHQLSYGSHGLQGGYYQTATISLDPANNNRGDEIDLYWLGTYFQNTNQAQAMAADAVNTFQRQGVEGGQSCYLADQPDCHIFILPEFVYAVWSTGSEMGELLFIGNIGFFGSSGVLVNHTDLFGHAFRQLLEAADGVLVTAAGGTPAPAGGSGSPPAPQVALKIDAIALYHDVRGNLTPTKVLHLQELVDFIAPIHVSNFGTFDASGNLQFLNPDGSMQLIKDVKPTPADPSTTKVVFDGSAYLGQEPSGALIFQAFGSFPSSYVLGILHGTFTVTMGASKASRRFDVTIQEAPAPCKSGYHALHGKCVKSK